MMPESAETLRAWDKAHLWHPFTAQADWAASDPLVIERGKGCYLFDSDGNRYLDGVASLWCNVHGHRHPTLNAALHEQVETLAHATILGVTHPTAAMLAHELVQRAPSGLSRVFFSDDGATAVEVALKMAFQYWRQKPIPEPRRTRFLALGGAYHGDTIGDVSIGGVDRFHAMFSPLLFPALRAPIPYCYRCPLELQRSSCAMKCLSELDEMLAEHHGEVVAVVIEPLVQGAAGMVVHPEGYLRGLREITRKHNTLLIADEVAVGFGKTGFLFACEAENVSPDFLCLAKGLTGGYMPMAATLTTEEVYSAFFATAAEEKTFQHGHTYGGNPLAAAVSLASLRVFDEEKTLENLVPKIALLTERLEQFRAHPNVGDVRQKGLIAGIELVADKESKREFEWAEQVGARICKKAREYGLLIRPIADILIVMPPLAISLDQLTEMLDVMERCLVEVTGRSSL